MNYFFMKIMIDGSQYEGGDQEDFFFSIYNLF